MAKTQSFAGSEWRFWHFCYYIRSSPSGNSSLRFFFSQQRHLLLEDGMFLIWMATIAQYLGMKTHFLGFWNFVKLCYWNFNQFHWNFMLFQNIWNFRTLSKPSFLHFFFSASVIRVRKFQIFWNSMKFQWNLL